MVKGNAIFSDSFKPACREVMELLHDNVGFKQWVITHRHEDTWKILHSRDFGFGMPEDSTADWDLTLCSKLPTDASLRFIPDTSELFGEPIPFQGCVIRSFIGVPIVYAGGTTSGSLAGLDDRVCSPEVINKLPLVEVIAELLSRLMQSELKRTQQFKEVQRLTYLSERDELTGLMNRRGWSQMVNAEDARSKRNGKSYTVFIVDMDKLKQINDSHGHEFGDKLIKSCADCLNSICRKSDVVARLGGDEFALMAAECGEEGAAILFADLHRSLSNAGISASIGFSVVGKDLSLEDAVRRADKAMYLNKHQRYQSNESASSYSQA